MYVWPDYDRLKKGRNVSLYQTLKKTVVSVVSYATMNPLKLSLFWDLALPGLVVCYRRFGPHRPPSSRVSRSKKNPSWFLKVGLMYFCVPSVIYCQPAPCNIPEERQWRPNRTVCSLHYNIVAWCDPPRKYDVSCAPQMLRFRHGSRCLNAVRYSVRADVICMTCYIHFDVLLTVHLSILTYLLTYLLTPWSRVLLEKLTSKLCR